MNSFTPDLRLGRWQDVLADETCDALLSDPPYGKRCHAGQRHKRSPGSDAQGWVSREGLGYDAWTPDDVHAFVDAWSPRTRGWMVCLTSHDLIGAYEDAYRAAGRLSFAPVPCIIRGMNVRLAGDGPSSWAVYAMVARPRTQEMSRWGTLRGAYDGPRDQRPFYSGGKPRWLMHALVRDYSRAGDLVCDPCAGGGTTLLSALAEGRSAIGAEVKEDAYRRALERLQPKEQQALF